MKTTNQWNEVADIFGCTGNGKDIPETVADNILVAWPSIINGIEQTLSGRNNLTALDFGCGGGLFCQKLHTMGYQVTGYEPSIALANAARANVPQEVNISHSRDVLTSNHYDLISAIMVMQFIENIEEVIARLANAVAMDGVIVSAVFNPAFVHDNMNKHLLFIPANEQGVACMEIRPGIQIPFYIRTAEDYRNLFGRLGMKEVYFDLPPFTADFVNQYDVSFSTQCPEFLIQAFRKQ